MKKKIGIIFVLGALFLAVTMYFLWREAEAPSKPDEDEVEEEQSRIAIFKCSEALLQARGDEYAERVETILKEKFMVAITGQTEEHVYVKAASEYADAAFCFEAEKDAALGECCIVLDIPGYDHRFYSVERSVNVYLRLAEKDYLLGTALVEETVYFLPMGEQDAAVWYDDDGVRKMLEQYKADCNKWEYIWLDGFETFDKVKIRTAREIDTGTPGTAWEAEDGTEREISLSENCRIIYAEQSGYREVSLKNFHSCFAESYSSKVYFLGWKNGEAVCVIHIFVS